MTALFELLRSWGLFGVVLIAILDSAGVPLPGGVDALLIAVAAVDPPRAYIAALLAVLGSLAGNLFLFMAAQKGGEAYLDKHTISPRAQKFRAWFQHYGLISIYIPCVVPLVPLPLKVFVLSAGALGVRRRTFLLTVLLARVPRYLAMAYLGAQLGDHSLEWLSSHKWYLAAIAGTLFLVLFAAIKLVDWRKRAAA